MPEYLSPGVYVEEVERGAKSIEGVSTSTAGFLGKTERGSVQPEFITSFAEFKRLYGGFTKYRRNEPLEGTNLAYAVNGFFNNGGGRCYVGRVTDAEETADVSLGGYVASEAPVSEEDEVDFGRVVTGRTVTETVDIEHPGIDNDPPIEITDVSTEGPFTVRSPEEQITEDEPYSLEPRKPLELEVDFQPDGAGQHDRQLTVDVDGDGPALAVDLSGVGVEPDVAADPTVFPSPIDFGTVPENMTRTMSVTLRNEGIEGASAVDITGLSLDQGPGVFDTVDDDHVADTSLGAGDSVTFGVELEHDLPDADDFQHVEDTLSITTDGDPSFDDVTLRADVVTPANTLGAELTQVEFGQVATTTTTRRTVVLRNLGGTDDATIENLNVTVSDDTHFDAGLLDAPASAELAPGESITLWVEFSPETDGELGEDVSVEYDPGGQTRTITLHGFGVDEDAEFGAQPPAGGDLDFGRVVVDESETRTVVLSNEGAEGAGEVTIEAVEFGDGDDVFDRPDDDGLVPDDLEPDGEDLAALGPGDTLEVPVTVTPRGIEEFENELTVDYEHDLAPDTQTDTWMLTAEGVESKMDIRAIGPGEWGERVEVTVRNGARTNETFHVTVRYWSELDDPDGTIADQGDPDVEETYSDLSAEEASSNYFETVIESGSNLVEVIVPEGIDPKRPDNGSTFLTLPPDEDDEDDEDDGVGLTHYKGDESAPRGERTGLTGFGEIDDISIVCVPDENSIDGLTRAVVSHCEKYADRIAVLQAEQGADPGNLPPQTAISEYAAIYYPHLKIVDSETGRRKLVPPGGHVAGIYARTDREQGVYKAPANETVRGAVDLEVPVTKDDQARLNPKGVNAIRSFPGRGIRVWGARTTSADPEWKYVNVRRLFLYLEESIDEGTQWAVFESNTEELWARVRQSVRNFLLSVWREGGLAGTTPEEAFYVKADRTTMTQADIDAGKLIVEIGVAPVKPAEFVIFRIAQWTEGLEEGS